MLLKLPLLDFHMIFIILQNLVMSYVPLIQFLGSILLILQSKFDGIVTTSLQSTSWTTLLANQPILNNRISR